MEPFGYLNSDKVRPWLLLTATAGLAALTFVGVVLPVEFGRDPLGIGHLTGLDALHVNRHQSPFLDSNSSAAARHYSEPFREDDIEIKLGYPGGGIGPYSLEYKLAMRAGDVILYEWKASGFSDDSALTVDFHGHTAAPNDTDAKTQVVVAEYHKSQAAEERGSLVAPFDGIHGWYFENRSTGPIAINLKVSGVYALIEPGQEGNQNGITPTGSRR